ncbi:hypothetical protein ABZP36_010951, partial [Zizania latifolia]
KSKPTQHSVRGLRGLGLQPDILGCHSTEVHHLAIFSFFREFKSMKAKPSQFCQVRISSIVNLHDVTNIWHIPLLLKRAHEAILNVLDLQLVGKVAREPKLAEWTERASKFNKLKAT